MRVEESLRQTATSPAEMIDLSLVFHALGDQVQVESLGHGDNRIDDRVIFGGFDALNKRTVDLQGIDWQIL